MITDIITTGILSTAGAAIIGMFIRIEHRLTKVETKLDFIQWNLTGCQQPSEDDTK